MTDAPTNRRGAIAAIVMVVVIGLLGWVWMMRPVAATPEPSPRATPAPAPARVPPPAPRRPLAPVERPDEAPPPAELPPTIAFNRFMAREMGWLEVSCEVGVEYNGIDDVEDGWFSIVTKERADHG